MKKKSKKESMKEFLKSVQEIADLFKLHAYVVDGKVTVRELKPNETKFKTTQPRVRDRNRKRRSRPR